MADFGKGLKSFKQSMREDAAFEEPEGGVREPKALPPETVARRPEATFRRTPYGSTS